MPPSSFGPEQRQQWLARLARERLDLLVIGGGVTGVGIARDAALRGLRVALVEREDLASGTSSKSSKLVHGGLRYLEQGRVGLTREACFERNLLMRLNPHLIEPLPFLFPVYRRGGRPLWQIRAGLWLYDLLAGQPPGAPTPRLALSAAETLARAPGLLDAQLSGAVWYHDAGVDDARLTVATAASAVASGAMVLTYCEVVGLERDSAGRVCGAQIVDRLAQSTATDRPGPRPELDGTDRPAVARTLAVAARAVVNATGADVDRVRAMARPLARPDVQPARGIHLIFSAEQLPLRSAVVLRSVDDRRPLFLIPWEGVLLYGTTDVVVTGQAARHPDQPGSRATAPGQGAERGRDVGAATDAQPDQRERVPAAEVEYLLRTLEAHFPQAGVRSWPIRAAFAGVRPLVTLGKPVTRPSAVSREHALFDERGLLSIAGGKLTTYRLMARQVLDRLLASPALDGRTGAGQPAGPCATDARPLVPDSLRPEALVEQLAAAHGLPRQQARRLVHQYGAQALALAGDGLELLSPDGLFAAEVRQAVRHEGALTLCDTLLRRIRLGLLGAAQGQDAATAVCAIMGEELGWDEARRQAELTAYQAELHHHYRPAPP